MRLLLPAAVVLIGLAPQPATGAERTGRYSKFVAAGECRDASKQFARKGGVWRSDPVKPKKLTELPPADSYAAVYRLDERGCMVPVKFRDVRR